MERNVILSDMPLNPDWDFKKGLECITKEPWEIKNNVSNKGRNKLYNIIRYFKYFYFPFIIFLNRKKYRKIVSWQAFYGVVYAFYCSVFRVEKKSFLLIKNFTYKPKGDGVLGRFYYNWMRYIVKSKYIDVFICTSQTFCEYCAEQFEEPLERFKYIPFGVEDFTKTLANEDLNCQENFVLSLGRSNRDWKWLIESIGNTKYKLKIVCDELKYDNLPRNIEILNNVWGKDSFRYIAKCKLMVIPIMDGKIGSGETVLLQAMSFGRPIIINKPSCLADDYVENERTGIIINKNRNELLEALERLYNDEKFYAKLSENVRNHYEEKHSIYKYGCNVGRIINEKYAI